MKNCYDWPNANCENYVFLFRTIVLYNGISINKRVGFFMNMKYSRCLNDSTYLPNMIGSLANGDTTSLVAKILT